MEEGEEGETEEGLEGDEDGFEDEDRVPGEDNKEGGKEVSKGSPGA